MEKASLCLDVNQQKNTVHLKGEIRTRQAWVAGVIVKSPTTFSGVRISVIKAALLNQAALIASTGRSAWLGLTEFVLWKGIRRGREHNRNQPWGKKNLMVRDELSSQTPYLIKWDCSNCHTVAVTIAGKEFCINYSTAEGSIFCLRPTLFCHLSKTFLSHNNY